MENKNHVIIALDGLEEALALRFAEILSPSVWGFKVNDLLFADPHVIGRIKRFSNVFADAKLYDIPHTVKNSVRRLVDAGADLITVHASGGVEMMRIAKENSSECKIIAVTVLTSTETNIHEVERLVKDAIEAGVDGIVCSGNDLKAISKIPGAKSLLKVVPGIRPTWYDKTDDQKRIATPQAAIDAGADFIVIGRPVLEAPDPVEAVKNL